MAATHVGAVRLLAKRVRETSSQHKGPGRGWGLKPGAFETPLAGWVSGVNLPPRRDAGFTSTARLSRVSELRPHVEQFAAGIGFHRGCSKAGPVQALPEDLSSGGLSGGVQLPVWRRAGISARASSQKSLFLYALLTLC